MRKLLSKLRYLLGRDRQADELAEELELHRDFVEREGLEEGLAPEEARRRARLRMGNETLAREDARSVWSFPIVDELWQDLRYGVRVLSRNRGSTVVTVLVLAMGIGLNTAVFTAYKAFVARPLDARNPNEMVNIALTRDSGGSSFTFSYADYEVYRDSIRSLSGLVATRSGRMTLSNAGSTISQRSQLAESWMGSLGFRGGSMDEWASVSVVSDNYFEVLGVTALRGRTFGSISRSELAAEPSVLISENYWRGRLAGDPAIIGKTIHLNSVPVTIIGITPRDFIGTGMGVPAFWLPAGIEPLVNADNQWLSKRENQIYRLFGRLAPGTTVADAQAEISQVSDHVRTLHDPPSESAEPATALVWPGSPFPPLPIEMNEGLQWILLLIMSATGIVLAVACANVASLQLARARSRENELRTRLSLGAGRLRVIRQLLTESVLVGLLAGTLALPFTSALLKELSHLISQSVPDDGTAVILAVPLDLEIFAYVFVISLFAGMLSGLAPAIESSRAALAAVVRAGTSSVRSRRLQGLLVAAQVSLSLVLLIAAGTLIRSSLNALNAPTGYDAGKVISLSVGFSKASDYTDVQELALIREVRARMAALPGVAAVTSAGPTGLVTTRFKTVALPLDEVSEDEQNAQSVLGYTYVGANYFETLGVPLLLGRSFEKHSLESEQSVILSESAAHQLWPNQNPIGHTLRLGPTDEKRHRESELTADGPTYQVVGVARDKRLITFDGDFSNEVYLPLPEGQLQRRPILIRVEGDPMPVTRAIDSIIASIDPYMWSLSATLEEMLRLTGPFVVSTIAAAVATTVGLFGLVLALIGIYGTVNYLVVLRTREVGVRMAIGAQRSDILSLILRETARPILVGLVFGMLLAVGVSYLGRGFLYGIDGIDGVSVACVSSLFLAVALLASYLPARRALRVDPLVALRYE